MNTKDYLETFKNRFNNKETGWHTRFDREKVVYPQYTPICFGMVYGLSCYEPNAIFAVERRYVSSVNKNTYQITTFGRVLPSLRPNTYYGGRCGEQEGLYVGNYIDAVFSELKTAGKYEQVLADAGVAKAIISEELLFEAVEMLLEKLDKYNVTHWGYDMQDVLCDYIGNSSHADSRSRHIENINKQITILEKQRDEAYQEFIDFSQKVEEADDKLEDMCKEMSIDNDVITGFLSLVTH